MLNKSFSRRTFLTQASTAVAASVWLPSSLRASGVGHRAAHAGHVLVPSAGRWIDPDLSALVAQAVDAAMSAGAQYADARLSFQRMEQWSPPYPSIPSMQFHSYGVGVRALLNGYWGFLGSAVWTPDEMVRLGRGAVAQAKANALGKTREASLGTIPKVVRGEWTMPVVYDPFTISYAEKYDLFNEVAGIVHQHSRFVKGGCTGKFARTEGFFASSEGSSWHQTTYLAQGKLSAEYAPEIAKGIRGAGIAEVRTLTPTGRGWELFTNPGLLDQIPALIDEAEQSRHKIPVDVGRYDVVCSAAAVAGIMNTTIGAASELDRAMGYEANAEGTSYLDRPLEMLGTFQVGSPLVNVTANRSQPAGAATVKWDDEAVVPEEFTLVKNGVLVDYQTTREQAAWLAPYYEKVGRPVRSHGCASTPDAAFITLQNPPNLQFMPGAQDVSFDDLVAGTEKGYAVLDAGLVLMDPQQLNGLIVGTIREIVKGKLGRFVYGGALDVRSPDFWKTLKAIGGPKHTEWFGFSSAKGEPVQVNCHSVGAVPAKFQNTAIIDLTRKA